MSTENSPAVAARFARYSSVIGFLVSLVVLYGWTFDVPIFTRIVSDWPRMVALAALAFALSSVSLWLAVPQPNLRRAAPASRQQISFVCAVLVVLIGVVRLVAHLSGWNIGWLDGVGLLNASTALARSTARSMQAVISRGQMSRLLPDDHPRSIVKALAVGAIAGVFVWRFVKTGGPRMLKIMSRPMEAEHVH